MAISMKKNNLYFMPTILLLDITYLLTMLSYAGQKMSSWWN